MNVKPEVHPFKRLLPAAFLPVGLAVALLIVCFFQLATHAPADVGVLEAAVRSLGLTPVRVGRLGVYLCDRPREDADLFRLARSPEAAGKWVGVVYAEFAPPVDALDDRTAHDWGRYGLRIGDWIFFGDPGLLAKIRERFR